MERLKKRDRHPGKPKKVGRTDRQTVIKRMRAIICTGKLQNKHNICTIVIVKMMMMVMVMMMMTMVI